MPLLSLRNTYSWIMDPMNRKWQQRLVLNAVH